MVSMSLEVFHHSSQATLLKKTEILNLHSNRRQTRDSKMKQSLVTVALVLSVIAIIISVIQPTYNFLTAMNKTENGTPSFNISGPDFYVFQTFTRITLRNNGTATVHDVNLNLFFTGFGLPTWEATEFVSEIDKSQSVVFEIPIGFYQLTSISSFNNVSSYEALVHITCKELGSTTTFQFQHFITITN
jgi:hypothetical protein